MKLKEKTADSREESRQETPDDARDATDENLELRLPSDTGEEVDLGDVSNLKLRRRWWRW